MSSADHHAKTIESIKSFRAGVSPIHVVGSVNVFTVIVVSIFMVTIVDVPSNISIVRCSRGAVAADFLSTPSSPCPCHEIARSSSSV